jgi:hypothetical protein
MSNISHSIANQNPDVIANRLLQTAHNRDGLPEMTIGFTFLLVAATTWLQTAFHPGSLGYTAAVLAEALLVPALILISQWAIKKLRRNFLVEKVGFVELKPVNRKRFAVLFAIVFVAAISVALAAVAGAVFLKWIPPTGWVLAVSGIGGGLLAAIAGRSSRFIAGGAAMAATGIALAFTNVSLQTGFTILYGSIGLLSLVSGIVVFLLLISKPVAEGN